MNTEKDFLERAVIGLTIENAKLQSEAKTIREDKSRFWQWYKDEKEKSDKLQVELDALKGINVEVESESKIAKT